MEGSKVLQRFKGFVVYAYIFFCSLLMSLFCYNNPFQIGFTWIDSSVFIYVAKVIIDGGMPYRDTFDHKGPLIYLIDALGLLLNEQIGIWIIEVITLFTIFLFTYKIANLLRCSRLLSCIIVTIGLFVLSYYFQGGNFTEEYACAFIIISLYFFLKYYTYRQFDCYEMILCGITFAFVCMLRINMVALWIVAFIGIMVEKIRNQRVKDISKYICWFIFGIAIVVLPIMLWLIVNNAFNDFIRDYFIFNFKYSSDPERASFINIIEAIKFFLMGPPILTSLPFLFLLCIKLKRNTDWLCAFTLLLSVVLSCISGQRYEHYGMIFYPLIVYAFCRVFYEFSLLEENSNKLKVKKFILLFFYSSLICCYLLSFSGFFFKKNTFPVFYTIPDLTIGKQIAIVIQNLTNENDRITAVGNADILYLLSNRKSASKYSYQIPIGKIYPKVWQEYIDDIRQLKAKVIVLPKRIKRVYPYQDIMKIVNDKYELINIVSGWEIYLLKDSRIL